MLRLVSDIVGLIALLALAGFLAHMIYAVTIGLLRPLTFRAKLDYLVVRSLLIIGWLCILVVHFFPEQAYLNCLAFIAGVSTVSLFLGVLYAILVIAVGKTTRVYFKNGEMKTYFPPRYSSDDTYYYFQKRMGGKEAVKRESVDRIEQITYRSLIPGFLEINKGPEKVKLALVKILIIKCDIAIMTVIFTLVLLTYLF